MYKCLAYRSISRYSLSLCKQVYNLNCELYEKRKILVITKGRSKLQAAVTGEEVKLQMVMKKCLLLVSFECTTVRLTTWLKYIG